ncbi:MAG: prepilin-type N-terminal cleavage/methylation domain-containing protein, partial [Acidimicrobiales bacterium]
MRPSLRPTMPSRRDEGGFTLIEMTISLTIMAVIALALGGVLHSGLRALGAAKARTQGNEVATQGIEDLQRYGFNDLGLCGSHTPSAPPAGLADLAMLPNCPTPVPAYDCNAAVGGAVPLAQYTCRRNNVDYTVRRYVAWVDPVHTTKRLAVFVDWDDLVGNHQVSQQSSLRAPDQGAIVGLAPPAFTSPPPSATASPNTLVLAADGTLPAGSTITLSAATLNMNGAASTGVSSAIPASRTAGGRFNLTVSSATGFPGYNGYPVKIGGELFTVLAGA